VCARERLLCGGPNRLGAGAERAMPSCCVQGKQSGGGEEGVVFKALTAKQMKKVRVQHGARRTVHV
jgi:hypothetical protein